MPRIALYGPESDSELLGDYPGRFAVTRCRDAAELESLLLAAPTDLVVLDCRDHVPPPEILELARDESFVDHLAVGRPEARRSLPSWLLSHWCPWPTERTSFYRLVVSMAQKAKGERAARRQALEIEGLEVEARLGRALARALHELGNPLDAVRRFVNLAAERPADPRAAGWLADAATGLDRMAAVLGDLHRDARRAGTKLSLVELRDVVREAAVISGVVNHGLNVRTRLEGGELRVPCGLTPVLTNLLLNARRSCEGTGRIEIRSARTPDGVTIDVEDDGEGFGELFKDELFRPYYTTRGHGEGLGLGLSESRNTVEQLGGRLDASSPGVGKGATFTVTLPLFETMESRLADGEDSGT